MHVAYPAVGAGADHASVRATCSFAPLGAGVFEAEGRAPSAEADAVASPLVGRGWRPRHLRNVGRSIGGTAAVGMDGWRTAHCCKDGWRGTRAVRMVMAVGPPLYG